MRKLFIALGVAVTLFAPPAGAAFSQSDITSLAKACVGHWDQQACLSAVSSSNMTMASEYGAALQHSGHDDQAESIKQHCAASTAATQGQYPAYALKSAFTECANTIVDVSNATSMKPDPDRYGIIITAVLCMSGDAKCAAMEKGLASYLQ